MPPSLQIDNQSITTYDDIAVGTKRASLTFTSNEVVTFTSGNAALPIRVTNLAIPSQQSDAANKQYVDAAILGLVFKTPVRAVAVAPGTLASGVAFGAGGVVDGVTLAEGDRLLLLGQTNAVENGIYVVGAAGVAPTRATDLTTGFHRQCVRPA